MKKGLKANLRHRILLSKIRFFLFMKQNYTKINLQISSKSIREDLFFSGMNNALFHRT